MKPGALKNVCTLLLFGVYSLCYFTVLKSYVFVKISVFPGFGSISFQNYWYFYSDRIFFFWFVVKRLYINILRFSVPVLNEEYGEKISVVPKKIRKLLNYIPTKNTGTIKIHKNIGSSEKKTVCAEKS